MARRHTTNRSRWSFPVLCFSFAFGLGTAASAADMTQWSGKVVHYKTDEGFYDVVIRMWYGDSFKNRREHSESGQIRTDKDGEYNFDVPVDANFVWIGYKTSDAGDSQQHSLDGRSEVPNNAKTKMTVDTIGLVSYDDTRSDQGQQSGEQAADRHARAVDGAANYVIAAGQTDEAQRLAGTNVALARERFGSGISLSPEHLERLSRFGVVQPGLRSTLQ